MTTRTARKNSPAALCVALSLGCAITLSAAPACANPTDTLTVQLGGASMHHIYNGLQVPATDVSVQWVHSGSHNGLVLALQWLHFMPADTTAPLIGGRVGWDFRVPDLPVEPYAQVALGLYAADVAPVLPIGFVGLGVRKAFANKLTANVSVDAMGSLFAVGVNPRVGVGYAF